MHSLCILIYVSIYLYSYLSTHGISGLAPHDDWEQFRVHLNRTIKWTRRYTPRLWLSAFGDAIGDQDWVNSEMHWVAVIERVWRCTLRLWSSESGDALCTPDWVNSGILGEAVTKRVWRSTLRQSLSQFGDTLGGRDRARLEMFLETEIVCTQ